MTWKQFLILALLALFIIVLLQNTAVVTFKFLVWQVSMSRIILIPGVALAGFAVGFITGRRLW